MAVEDLMGQLTGQPSPMGQGAPMGQGVPTGQPGAPPAGQQSIGSALGPLVSGPVDDFIVTLLSMMDDRGILNEAMSPAPPSIEQQVDDAEPIQEGDPLEYFSRAEIETLVAKFEATPPEFQQQIIQALQAEDPRAAQRIQAAIRMVRGSGGAGQPSPVGQPNMV
jgi:hypothetical protein